MIIFKKRKDLYNYLEAQRQTGYSIGFIPTMGALHAGHLSLIETSLKANPVTVCSIFVNPTQFNDPKDFEKYPVTIEKDIELLANAGCEILFLPSVKEIYPDELSPTLKYDLGYLEEILEGKFRPGHFQGVCMVVHRLLEIVMPDNLYLGQKDYQQCMVIKKLIELTGLSKSVCVNICPTLREPDGLAMSSRNVRLSDEERKKATAIFRNLSFIKTNLKVGNLKVLKETAFKNLSEAGLKVDYIEIADANDLSIIDDWDGQKKIVALAAAYMSAVRLIDNIILY